MLKTGMIVGDRYEVVSKIGTGGMANVYKAKDHKLNRFVAMKVLKQEFREDTTFIKKFKTEAQSAAGLTHPNIVNVFDVGEDEGVHYIVMELVEGITLKDYISKVNLENNTNISIIAIPYTHDEFSTKIKGMEDEKEGGNRCKICFSLRLDYAGKYAKDNGFDIFATTLTVSPHKNFEIINTIIYNIFKYIIARI